MGIVDEPVAFNDVMDFPAIYDVVAGDYVNEASQLGREQWLERAGNFDFGYHEGNLTKMRKYQRTRIMVQATKFRNFINLFRSISVRRFGSAVREL